MQYRQLHLSTAKLALTCPDNAVCSSAPPTISSCLQYEAGVKPLKVQTSSSGETDFVDSDDANKDSLVTTELLEFRYRFCKLS
jgi:hypothetical protein